MPLNGKYNFFGRLKKWPLISADKFISEFPLKRRDTVPW